MFLLSVLIWKGKEYLSGESVEESIWYKSIYLSITYPLFHPGSPVYRDLKKSPHGPGWKPPRPITQEL